MNQTPDSTIRQSAASFVPDRTADAEFIGTASTCSIAAGNGPPLGVSEFQNHIPNTSMVFEQRQNSEAWRWNAR